MSSLLQTFKNTRCLSRHFLATYDKRMYSKEDVFSRTTNDNQQIQSGQDEPLTDRDMSEPIKQREKKVFSRSKVMELLHTEIDMSPRNVRGVLSKYKWRTLKKDQRFIPERLSILGPDLAAAHFLVKRGAKVKFIGQDQWFQRDEKRNVFLPDLFVPDLYLEAIDASSLELTYAAFDNMVPLQELRYLKFGPSTIFNDWCLAKLYLYRSSLEFLEISGCPEVTENGMACLHHLKKLRGLKLKDLPKVKDIGLLALRLEEALPECLVFGLTAEQQKPAYDHVVSDRLAYLIQLNKIEPNSHQDKELDFQRLSDKISV